MKLNLGCGRIKLEGFINVDKESSVEPDLLFDFVNGQLPYEEGSVEEVWSLHCLEHIEYKDWGRFLLNSWRVLVPNGTLVLGYPEFEKCAKYYIENYRGQRSFWRKALYGGQDYPGDYHVSPVMTTQLKQILRACGFIDFKSGYEAPGQEYATILKCTKGIQVSREDQFRDFLWEKVEAEEVKA